jgi:hypothetical protein
MRRLFRIRCRKWLARGNMIWSIRQPDRIEENGTITDGTEIAVYGSITCRRLRWHLGEHRP